MAGGFPRGSEWRRWDLHIHAPGTALNDEFGGWDEYVTGIEANDHGVAVVGVTDYASIESYKRFLQYRKKGCMQNIAMALPNIEFRISPETKDGKGINVHVLVSPDEDDHVSRIEQALHRLTIKRHNENVSCTRDGLIALGKLTKAALAQSPEAAYREGVNQFKVDFEVFRDWYEREVWLSKNSLIGLAAGSKDGASGLVDGGYLSTRREIYAFADVIFSGNPSEREAWLGRGGIKPEEFAHLRGLKPTIHGSDAHSLDKVFRPEKDRYCWIKADPTFEGLRQILYEPDDRAWIGEAPPTTHEARSTIESISLVNTNGWFDEAKKIPLNSGMVSIIGLKGSGKTALADLIAFASGANVDPANSFIARAEEHLSGLGVVVQWRNDDFETGVLPNEPGGQSGRTVKYLSQKFVDQLCSGDTLSDELQREVESVVFQHLPLEDRWDANDFSDLRQLRTEGIQENRRDVSDRIQDDSRQIANLETRRAEILKKRQRCEALPKQIADLDKGVPKVNDTAMQAKLKELEQLRQLQAKSSRSVAELRAKKQNVQDSERKLRSKIEEVRTFWSGFESTLKSLGFTSEAIQSLAPSWSSPPAVFKTRLAEIEQEIEALEGKSATVAQGAAPTLRSLSATIKQLEGELQIGEANKRKVLEVQRRKRELTEEKRKLDEEFEWLEQKYKNERQATFDRRLNSYLSYFELLKEERDVLEQLYQPLRDTLSQNDGQQKKLGVVCRIEVDSDAWLSHGAELFDLRKTGTFNYGAITEIVTDELHKAWESCDGTRIKAALQKCLGLIKESDVLKNQLKTGFQPLDVAHWLFSVDHIAVTHGIQFEGKDLRLLSPGTKGIVLLILYLAVDHSDTRPLIVDQPDENLDNLSTYSILRQYFREAKKRRQIIVITHNPNLVVNTDAEQVIVAESNVQANGLPFIQYSCGSLESEVADGPLAESIRSAVCRIMEGGKDAFRSREHRYGQVLDAP